jgi:hypothetical protein
MSSKRMSSKRMSLEGRTPRLASARRDELKNVTATVLRLDAWFADEK